MTAKSTKEYQEKLLNKLTFSPKNKGNFIIYRNENQPELGYLIKYYRKDYYEFIVGDYLIPDNFSLSFDHNEEIIKFGTVYKGETNFKIKNNHISSFSPSSFFVREKTIVGTQTWKKGQHFRGAEFIIHKKYFDEVISNNLSSNLNLDSFITNYTYNYLPVDVALIITTLNNLAKKDQLSMIYLEAKLLECIALIEREINKSDNKFASQLNYGNVKIGKNRYVTLTSSDVAAIQVAHNILSNNPCNPPTISSLSKIVFLNEQKLKVGFQARYNMTIGQYSTSLKMALAEKLLCSTELSIEEISKTLGYHHSSNFVKAFKKTHDKTPLAFRKHKQL